MGISSLVGSFVPLGIDPQPARRFLFEVDGVPIGLFNEVTGLSVSIETQEIREGGQNAFVHHVPGRMVWPNITFRRGLTQSDNLFDWFEKTSGEGFAGKRNRLARETAAISVVAELGIRLRSWSLVDAFPVRWTGPALSANSTETVMEELEIAHHGFTSSMFPI
jgi:phage tail-like protein